MISGAIVLFRPKGGRIHRFIGYLYGQLDDTYAGDLVYDVSTHREFQRAAWRCDFQHADAFHRPEVCHHPPSCWPMVHRAHPLDELVLRRIDSAFFAELSIRLAMPYLAEKFPEMEMGVFWLTVGLVSAFIIWIGSRWIRRFAPALARSPSNQDADLDSRR